MSDRPERHPCPDLRLIEADSGWAGKVGKTFRLSVYGSEATNPCQDLTAHQEPSRKAPAHPLHIVPIYLCSLCAHSTWRFACVVPIGEVDVLSVTCHRSFTQPRWEPCGICACRRGLSNHPVRG